MPPAPLPFETEIHQMELALAKLESEANANVDEIRRIRRELYGLLKKMYANLSAWNTVLVSRHPERPQTMDYVDLIFEEFVELHGDRAFGDDRAIRCGFAQLGGDTKREQREAQERQQYARKQGGKHRGQQGCQGGQGDDGVTPRIIDGPREGD